MKPCFTLALAAVAPKEIEFEISDIVECTLMKKIDRSNRLTFRIMKIYVVKHDARTDKFKSGIEVRGPQPRPSIKSRILTESSCNINKAIIKYFSLSCKNKNFFCMDSHH